MIALIRFGAVPERFRSSSRIAVGEREREDRVKVAFSLYVKPFQFQCRFSAVSVQFRHDGIRND